MEGLFEQLVKKAPHGLIPIVEQDVERCFADHPHLQDPRGSLANLILAYTAMVPGIRYRNGLTRIAGHLLLQAPDEDAFWIFVAIMDSHLRGYYHAANTDQFEIDASLFQSLVESADPLIIQNAIGLRAVDICESWFSCLFAGVLPPDHLYRIWDVLLYEGSIYLFRVALALIMLCKLPIMTMNLAKVGRGPIIELLGRPPSSAIPQDPETFISYTFTVKVRDDDLRKVRLQLEAGWRKDRTSAVNGTTQVDLLSSDGPVPIALSLEGHPPSLRTMHDPDVGLPRQSRTPRGAAGSPGPGVQSPGGDGQTSPGQVQPIPRTNFFPSNGPPKPRSRSSSVFSVNDSVILIQTEGSDSSHSSSTRNAQLRHIQPSQRSSERSERHSPPILSPIIQENFTNGGGEGNAAMPVVVSDAGDDREVERVYDWNDDSSQDEEGETRPILEKLMTTRTPLDLTGQVVVSDYRRPAHGGLAVVYPGLWNDRLVAVKLLKFQKDGGADTYWDMSNERRVKREINVWAALKHPNINEFLGYSADLADFPAMISPWCQLGTVSEHLKRHALSVNKRMKLAQDVSRGLEYLHQLKVVHGDVKPANILVDDEGLAKLCDFGLVRLVDWEGPAGMTTTSPYTGTERYKAPELFVTAENRRPVATFAGDIYSLGCVMLEFIERIYPFQRFTKTYELRDAIMDGYPPALRSETTHVLQAMMEFFWNLLEACWHGPPDRPSIRVVVDALDDFARMLPGSPVHTHSLL